MASSSHNITLTLYEGSLFASLVADTVAPEKAIRTTIKMGQRELDI